MNNFSFTFLAYINYLFEAKGNKLIHSPFVYKFYESVIKQSNTSSKIEWIEEIRKSNLRNKQVLDVIDFKSETSARKTISQIAKTSSSKLKFSIFLKNLCEFMQIKTALECGSSLGLNALYLSEAQELEKLITIEGSKIIAHQASKNINYQQKRNIELINDNIYHAFPLLIAKHQPELIFLDADHRSTAIEFYLKTFKQVGYSPKCIIIHDIYWSKDMNNKWKELIASSEIPLTIDLFQAGILFPEFPGTKQHFILRF